MPIAKRLRGEARNGAVETIGGRIPWRHKGSGYAEVLFHPEAVRLMRFEEAPLRGKIVNALFMGDRTRLSPGEEVGLEIDPAGLFTLAGDAELAVRPPSPSVPVAAYCDSVSSRRCGGSSKRCSPLPRRPRRVIGTGPCVGRSRMVK